MDGFKLNTYARHDCVGPLHVEEDLLGGGVSHNDPHPLSLRREWKHLGARRKNIKKLKLC